MRAAFADLRGNLQRWHGEVLARGKVALIEALVAPGYVSHVPRFLPGGDPAPGAAALATRLAARGTIPNRLRRLIVDGELAFAHVEYLGGAAAVPIAGVDVYHFDAAGRIDEHWCVRQPMPADAEAGIDRFADAPLPTPAARHEPAVLRERVASMLRELWSLGDATLVPRYYDERYVQHNPDMPGGYGRIREVVERDIRGYIARAGGPFPIEVHHLAAEGDLVAVQHSIFMAGINRLDGSYSTNVDIFRVGDDGRMLEHWDVLQIAAEPLPDERTLF